MKGTFINKEECIKNLRNQCYIFYTSHNGIMYFYSKEKQEIAEIKVYSDGSASELIGKYKV